MSMSSSRLGGFIGIEVAPHGGGGGTCGGAAAAIDRPVQRCSPLKRGLTRVRFLGRFQPAMIGADACL